MKLNPPASSSDLEAAREIARRLHQRRRRADFAPSSGAPPAPVGAERRSGGPRPVASIPAPAPSAPLPLAPPPIPRPARPLSVLPAQETPPPAPPAVEPEPPGWDDAEAEPGDSTHLQGALGDLDDMGGDDGEAAIGEAVAAPATAGQPELAEPEPEPETAAEALATGLPGVDVEIDEETISPDEMVGAAPEAPPADEDPFREPLGDVEVESPDLPASVGASGEEEEIFDDAPAPPSWDDVVENCRGVAGATGAMIIDPAGQVFAARGDWPEPGPDAIAGRLVVMMERTLKDAPTRSVSAPVGGQHLTAWRVPIAEGLLTAAFIADAPLRSEVRAAIDAEIHRGAGA